MLNPTVPYPSIRPSPENSVKAMLSFLNSVWAALGMLVSYSERSLLAHPLNTIGAICSGPEIL